jgi:arylsulfatase A-like enzyme
MVDGKQPNILVIWGDDIGITNLSCYSDGLMGYRTPNIDRIAEEGTRFTDAYGEQSCTAGRSSLITGQSVYRTGLSKVGMPGVDVGLQAEDPTIAELLKPLGYATGQFGKNHLGDLNKFFRRPTASTSSSATCITSTPKRSPSLPTGRHRRSSLASTSGSGPGGSSTRGRPTMTTGPRMVAMGASGASGSRTPDR